MSRAESVEAKRHPRLLPALAVVGVLVAIVTLRARILADLDLKSISVLATLVTGACALILIRTSPHRVYSAGFLYLIILCLFHLGLPYLLSFGVPFSATYRDYLSTWFLDVPYVREAVYLSMLAALCFTTAWLIASLRTVAPEPKRRTSEPDPMALARLGVVLVWIGFVSFVGSIVIIDPTLLAGGQYNQFDTAVGGTGPVALGMELIAIGGAMVAAAPKCGLRRAALVALAVFGVITLLLGSRTAFLYGGVGIVVAAARMHKMPRLRAALPGIVLGTVLIGAVAQLRNSNQTAGGAALNLTPVPAITEMGASLRPLSETISWRRGYGEGEYHGSTYVAGVERIFERLEGIPRPTPDPRFAGTLLSERVSGYNLGYSAVAEAFLNFGTSGVVIIFLGMGYLIGKLERSFRGNAYASARMGVILYVLGYEVRQSSNIMFTLLAGGMLIIGGAELWGRRQTRRSNHNNPPAWQGTTNQERHSHGAHVPACL